VPFTHRLAILNGAVTHIFTGSISVSFSPIHVLLASHVVALPIFPLLTSLTAVFIASLPLPRFFTHCAIQIVATGFSTTNLVHFLVSASVAHKTPHTTPSFPILGHHSTHEYSVSFPFSYHFFAVSATQRACW